MKKTTLYGFIILQSVIVLLSCSKGGGSSQNPTPVDNTPSIISVSPLIGGPNTVVTITGNNFNSNPSLNIVKFNGINANISSASETILVVTVPPGATTGAITITVNNKTFTGPIFFVSTLYVSTLAGTGTPGHVDGISTLAQFNYPFDICLDVQGNIYVSDYNQIRKITPAGIVSTLAGSGIRGFLDGPGNIAQFNPTMGIAADLQGNIYVADRDNQRIRKIAPDGTVSTFAGSGISGYEDGPGINAKFWSPHSLTVDAQGNVYVTDRSNYRIRKITTNGTVSTLAGSGILGYADGPGINAKFFILKDIAMDNQGNVVVIDGQRIRKISPSGDVSTFAGSGNINVFNAIGILADFDNPNGLCVDLNGNILIGEESSLIRKINPSALVSTLAGNIVPGYLDGPALTAKFLNPYGVAVDPLGSIYVADFANHRIRKISY